MKRSTLLASTVLALATLCAMQPAAADDGGASATESVSLDIRNRTGAPLRCVVILAHFVTRDIAEVAPGEAFALALQRTPVLGVLAYGEHAGEPMLVENILCGAAASWELQHTDLGLMPLRADGARRYAADCVVADRFHCSVEAIAPE